METICADNLRYGSGNEGSIGVVIVGRKNETMLQQITKKVFAGERITGEEGLWLMQEAELLDLVPLADHWRQRHNPKREVSYVVDTNLNYTNLCDAYCSFCAFYRTDPNDPSAR